MKQQNSIMADTAVTVDSIASKPLYQPPQEPIDRWISRGKKECEKRDESCVAPKIYAANVLSIDRVT